MADNTVIRSVHDLTQAAWFGGALMGAVGVDAAARTAEGGNGTRIADAAWSSWHRVSNPAIAAHLAAGLGMTLANRTRLARQRGAARVTALRSAVTLAAVGAEAYTRRLGRAVATEADRDAAASPPNAGARLRQAQWALVALTGVMIALGARMGEQQRPSQQTRGMAARLGLHRR